MPSHILHFGRPHVTPTSTTAALPTSTLSFEDARTKHKKGTFISIGERRPSFTMDHFHRDHDKKDKRHSLTAKIPSSAKQSPRLAATKPAKIEVLIESPPLVFHGTAAQSTGALLSGQLKVDVTDAEVKFQTFEMRLLASVTTKKPVVKDCPACTTKSNELTKWVFVTEPMILKKGEHLFPFSFLFPGHLPATSHGPLGVIEYTLNTHALTSLSESIDLKHPLKIQRAIIPGSDKKSLRVFPPTNLSATVTLPSVIYPIGAFPIKMVMSGVVTKGKDTQTRWRLRKFNWRIDEHSRMVSPACHKHSNKVGGDGKGILHQDMRSIGGDDVKDTWKTDFDKEGGVIELEIQASIKPDAKPLCDVESPSGVAITHHLTLEMIVSEEYCPNKNPKLVTPTGAARVLKICFLLHLTERSGLGISWDEEQPPMYSDVPASPPGYGRAVVEDYEGDPLPYEELDRMHF